MSGSTGDLLAKDEEPDSHNRDCGQVAAMGVGNA